MEYLVTAGEAARPFEEIEMETIDALEQMGFSVRRTFSLRSATGDGGAATVACPGYSVLRLYAADRQGEPMGLVTLYQQAGQTAIRPAFALHSEGGIFALPGRQDLEATFVEFLMRRGLEVCVGGRGGATCIDAMAEDPERGR